MKDQFKLSKLLPMLPTQVVEAVKERLGDVEEVDYRRKTFACSKAAETLEDEHAIIQYVSTRDVDRDNEILDPDGAMLDEFRLAPQVLWAHNYSDLPIAKDEYIKSDGYGIKAKTIYAVEQYPFAATVYALRKGSFLNTASVGFIPMQSVDRGSEEWDGKVAELKDKWGVKPSYFKQAQRIYTQWLLLEHSDVPVPANINALTLQKSVKIPDEYLSRLGIPDEPDEPWPIQKPLPNEHSCRLRSPDDFQADTFRRVSRESDGKKYYIIMGKLTGETTMTEQAYRYPKDVWEVAAARAHCKAHDGQSFEAAREEEGMGEPPIVRRVSRIVRPVSIVRAVPQPVDEGQIIQEVLDKARGKP